MTLRSEQVLAIHDAAVAAGVLVQPGADQVSAQRRGKLTQQYVSEGSAQLGTLQDGFYSLFESPEARRKNTGLFTPDMMSLKAGIELMDSNDAWESAGITVSLHGYGYLFSWTMKDVMLLVSAEPRLLQHKRALEGLVCVPPWKAPRKHLGIITTWTSWEAGAPGWAWAVSQSF